MALRALLILAAFSAASAYYPGAWNSWNTEWDSGNWRDVFLWNDPYKWETARFGKRALFENELNIIDPQIRALKRAERSGLLPKSDYLFNPTTGPWRHTDQIWETEKLWEEIDQKRGGCRRHDLIDVVNPWRRDYEYQLGGEFLGDLTTTPFNTWGWNRLDWPENRWQERQLEKEIVREEILREEYDQPRFHGRDWRGAW